MTERTVYAWYSGRTAIPYAAYKLLRILRWFELPGPWAGWSMHSGKLWSPEGLGFAPSDANWWTILVRKASQFDDLVRSKSNLELRVSELGTLLEHARAGDAQSRRAELAAGAAPALASPGEVLVTPHKRLNSEPASPSLVAPSPEVTELVTRHKTAKTGEKSGDLSSTGSFVPLSTAPYGRWFNSPSRFPRGGEE